MNRQLEDYHRCYVEGCKNGLLEYMVFCPKHKTERAIKLMDEYIREYGHDIPVPDLTKSKHPGGVDMLTYAGGKSPAFDEYIYRKKWLELHKKADNLVFDEETRLPVRAEYLYLPTQMNNPKEVAPSSGESKAKETQL